MTPQQAQQLSNAESSTYDSMIAASNAWTDRDDVQQAHAYALAYARWHEVLHALNDATLNHPEAFAAFKATW